MDQLIRSDVHVACDDDDRLDSNVEEQFGIVRTRFEFCWPASSSKYNDETNVQKDEDDDFVLPRRSIEKDIILIEHAEATKLSDVGLQIWNGAVLMADFVLSHKNIFANKTVLELGCGVGFVSICLAAVGANVVATDVDENVIKLCEKNFAQNGTLTSSGSTTAKLFDWNADVTPNNYWNDAEIENVHRCDVIVAADVIYDPFLNESLFKCIKNLCKYGNKIIYISIEKRLNFTLSHLDVVCPAYDDFVDFMKECQENRWEVKQLDLNFVPQCFNVERNQLTELWELRSKNEKIFEM